MLNAVADSTDAHDDREVVVLVGGSVLLDWLLGRVSAEEGSGCRNAAVRAVINLLNDSTYSADALFLTISISFASPASFFTAGTASALLGRPGAIPTLLQAVNHADDDARALADALLAAIPTASLPMVALLEDVQHTLDLVGDRVTIASHTQTYTHAHSCGAAVVVPHWRSASP